MESRSAFIIRPIVNCESGGRKIRPSRPWAGVHPTVPLPGKCANLPHASCNKRRISKQRFATRISTCTRHRFTAEIITEGRMRQFLRFRCDGIKLFCAPPFAAHQSPYSRSACRLNNDSSCVQYSSHRGQSAASSWLARGGSDVVQRECCLAPGVPVYRHVAGTCEPPVFLSWTSQPLSRLRT